MKVQVSDPDEEPTTSPVSPFYHRKRKGDTSQLYSKIYGGTKTDRDREGVDILRSGHVAVLVYHLTRVAFKGGQRSVLEKGGNVGEAYVSPSGQVPK